MLLYTSKGVSGTSHFRIRGLLPLRGMLVSAELRQGPTVVHGQPYKPLLGYLCCFNLLWFLSLGPTCSHGSPSRALQTLPPQDKGPAHLSNVLLEPACRSPREHCPLVGNTTQDSTGCWATLLLEEGGLTQRLKET